MAHANGALGLARSDADAVLYYYFAALADHPGVQLALGYRHSAGVVLLGRPEARHLLNPRPIFMAQVPRGRWATRAGRRALDDALGDFKLADAPLEQARWYMDQQRRAWCVPSSPLLHAGAKCGDGPDPHRDPREDSEVIDLIMNNLVATAHSLYMHGIYFDVINYADCSWCCIHT